MYKKWLKQFLFFAILLLIILELNYQYNRKNFIRHGLDYKIANILPKVKNKKFKTIMFSTSVTYGAVRKCRVKNNILDLCTVHSVGLLGQYFMLKRYLKSNRVDSIYMFVLPEIFYDDLKQVNYLYIESVFDRNDEKEYLEKLGLESFEINYFYSRIEYLKFWKSTFRYFDREVLDISNIKIDIKQNSINSMIDSSRLLTSKPISENIKSILKNFLELCQKYNIELTMVMEPLNSTTHIEYKSSNLAEYINSNGIKLIEFNDIHSFDNSDFFDTTHLNDIKQKEYLYLIDKYILNFLVKKESE